MSRFCEQCGAPLEPNENFCPSCGAKVIRDEPPTSTPSQQSYTPPPTSTPPVNSTAPPAENNMGKILVLIGIVLIIFAGIYLSTNKQSSEETSLGGFYLNMSKQEADEKFGAGVPDDRAYKYANGDFWLKFNEYDKAFLILCFDETVRTQKGIRIGSTLDEVKRAYGTNYEFDNTTFAPEHVYSYQIGNTKLVFFVDKETNCIEAIRLEWFYF